MNKPVRTCSLDLMDHTQPAVSYYSKSNAWIFCQPTLPPTCYWFNTKMDPICSMLYCSHTKRPCCAFAMLQGNVMLLSYQKAMLCFCYTKKQCCTSVIQKSNVVLLLYHKVMLYVSHFKRHIVLLSPKKAYTKYSIVTFITPSRALLSPIQSCSGVYSSYSVVIVIPEINLVWWQPFLTY